MHDLWLKGMMGVALVLYAAVVLLYATDRKRMAWGAMIVAWTGNASVVGLNGWLVGDPPLGNMYHVMVFLSLCMFPALLVLVARDRLSGLLPWFAGAAFFPLIGALFMKEGALWRRVPALQSVWFVPHVVSYMFSYALCTVAFLLALVQGGLLLKARWRPAADSYASAAYSILRLAFPFLTFGLLSGALWAEEAWGRYWSWDVKESWALVTWLFYLIYFHCRKHVVLMPWVLWAHLAAFASLVITFLVVNLGLIHKLSSALHGYA